MTYDSSCNDIDKNSKSYCSKIFPLEYIRSNVYDDNDVDVRVLLHRQQQTREPRSHHPIWKQNQKACLFDRNKMLPSDRVLKQLGYTNENAKASQSSRPGDKASQISLHNVFS